MSPAARTDLALARFRDERTVAQSACRLAGDFLANSPGCHEPALAEISAPLTRLHPCAQFPSRRCDNSTAPPTELPASVTFPPTRDRKMRPADDCKPDCQRRVPVHPVPTASRRALARPDPVRRAVHAAAARFGSLLVPVSKSSHLRCRTVQLASDASSRHSARPAIWAHTARLGRFPRRPVTDDGSDDPKRLRLASEP